MKELRKSKQFPPKNAFFNKMKQQEVDDDVYNTSKAVFNNKIAVGEWISMADYLKYYNLLDVEPLVQALQICFENYAKILELMPTADYHFPALASRQCTNYSTSPCHLPFLSMLPVIL